MSLFLGHVVGDRSGDLQTPTDKEVGDLEDVRSDSGVRGGTGQEIGIGDTEEIGKTVCVERPRVCKNPADPTSPAKIGYRPVNVIAVQQG